MKNDEMLLVDRKKFGWMLDMRFPNHKIPLYLQERWEYENEALEEGWGGVVRRRAMSMFACQRTVSSRSFCFHPTL